MSFGARMTLLASIAFLYLYTFPYFEKIRSANELPRLYQSMAIVDEGVLHVDTGVARYGSTADLSRFHDHYYPNKAPGMSLLGAPAYLLARVLSGGDPSLRASMLSVRLLCATLPALAFLLLGLPLLLRELGVSQQGRWATVAAYGLGTVAFPYAKLFMSHQVGAAFVGTSMLLLLLCVRKKLASRWLIVAGATSGISVVIEYQAAFAVVILTGYALWQMRPRRDAALFLIGGLPFVVLLAWYHQACFGGPLETGYQHALTSRFAAAHAQGLLGLTTPNAAALSRELWSLKKGLFIWSPLWLLAVPGTMLLWRRARSEAWIAIGGWMVALYLASSLVFVGGWTVGPRYLAVFLPLLLPALGLAIDASRRSVRCFSIAAGLVIASLLLHGLAVGLFPHFPTAFRSPLSHLLLPLLSGGYAPHSLGTWLGLPAMFSLVPYWLALVAATATMASLAKSRRLAAALGSGFVALAFVSAVALSGGSATKREQKTYDYVQRIWEPAHPRGGGQ